jgi:hypothetical protein
MAYNFATAGYHSFFKASPGIDSDALRKEAVRIIKSFSPRSWHDEPVRTLMNGEPVTSQDDVMGQTVDAFGNENGKQVLASASVVDKVIAHARGFKASVVDQRTKARLIEDAFFKGPLAASLVAMQAMDFHKQDGITEIEESNQAFLVERGLNDALFQDELDGKVAIGRAAAFVGCVSNFTNFLDLCRKILRNIELGVPVVVLSRSNTTQHMYRYIVQLLALMKEHGLHLGLCTYCSCTVEEQRRLLSACCAESPMYFTGSRLVASRIKEVLPRLMASTGGPNTMVVSPEQFVPEVAQAARMSNLIEHKGQCTALRHLVLPKAKEADIHKIYEGTTQSSSAAESLEKKETFATLKHLAKPLAAGYSKMDLPGGNGVAIRLANRPPAEIDEQWREAYMDVTAPDSLSPEFLQELAGWLNREQPISLAMNCGVGTAKELFETTSMVVYTVGNVDKSAPALTCQARPQDGECFGEFPARHLMDSVTAFPVIIPSSTPGYNSSYNVDFLGKHGAAPWEQWGVPTGLDGCKVITQRLQNPEQKGFCRVLLEYLLDAATGPRRGCGTRTSLFGVQRPPLGCKVCLRLEKADGPNLPHQDALFDLAARYIIPFVATNAKDQLVVSLDPFVSFPSAPALSQLGLQVVREAHDAFAASKGNYWNVVSLPKRSDSPSAVPEFPLVSHFVSTLLPMGHIKSTLPNDVEFLEAFSASPKWLRIAVASRL